MIDRTLQISSPWFEDQANRLYVAIAISMALHIIILMGINFKLPDPPFNNIAKSLEVILVNSKSEQKPIDAKALAQSNLDGGGNVDENRRAKTPFPVLPKSKPLVNPQEATQKTKQLEEEVKRLMTAAKSKPQIPQPDITQTQTEAKSPIQLDSTELLQRSLEIARLEAQIAKEHEEYQKRPKRKFIGARTKEYRFARYVEDWRMKVERIGNLNYPEAAKKEKLYGSLQLTVGIRSDGSLESIGIDRSSGFKVLDEAAVRIVRIAAQNGFAAFPPDISRDTDILHITRTWVFARSDKLHSE